MLAVELLSEIVPAVHPNDTTQEALNWMDVFKVSHLPVVDGDNYLGLISDADIFDLNSPNSIVTDQNITLQRPFVKSKQHIYEVINAVSKYRITVIPVIDKDEKFLGVITINDLAHEFSQLMSSDNLGGIIVLELKENDYSLSEIAQIVESNDNKILSLYVRSFPGKPHIHVTIKLNTTNLAAVLQTFERYSYKIAAVYSDSEDLDFLMRDRLDSFFKFISI